jgi:putative flippase GtrA
MKFDKLNFLAFLITGAIAAIFNFFIRIIFNLFYSFEISIILSYLLAMVLAFFLKKKFVFTKSGQALHLSILFFLIVNLVGMLQTWIVTMWSYQILFNFFKISFYPREISHLLGISAPIFTSYFGHKYFTFAKKTKNYWRF